MTDLEITRLCAEAMGYSVVKGDARYKNGMAIATEGGDPVTNYDPLKHDAQAMALVKKFRLTIYGHNRTEDEWAVFTGWRDSYHPASTQGGDLNRAICEFVAKMQEAKGTT